MSASNGYLIPIKWARDRGFISTNEYYLKQEIIFAIIKIIITVDMQWDETSI